MTRRRLIGALLALSLIVALAVPASAAGKPRKPGPTPTPTSALVLYDTTGPYGHLGELYAMQAANLVSHFTTWTAAPTSSYTAGKLANHTALVYVGSTYDEPLPTALLDDVLATTKPVLWLHNNIWQLRDRTPTFVEQYGFRPTLFDSEVVTKVRYKGVELGRHPGNGSGLMGIDSLAPTTKVLAEAVRADGVSTLPWAVQGANLTYIGEMPFAYLAETDRYLAFSDILFDVFAPSTPERHRAMVRLEDVGPDANPETLRAIADYLSSKGIPFSVATYPRYRDPNGFYNNGIGEEITLRDTPEVVSALKYMQSKGGTLVMHGWTHQYEAKANPYNGVSGDDFEFYLAHVDELDYVRYDGPVPEDSTAWALSRVDGATRDLKAVGIAAPTIFEFPHYAASATDYKAIATRFTTRFDRGLYFGGTLSGGTIDHSRMVGQFFPYVVKDVYGTKVLPETMGDYSPVEYNHHPARLPADLIETARKGLVVRDGFASFFYHPFLGTEALKEIVEGIDGIQHNGAKAFTWVSPASL